MTEYAELHAHSAYSFLDGASMPEELVSEAVRLELSGLALSDHNGLYGAVRLAQAARAAGLPTVLGAELTIGAHERTGVPDPAGDHLVVLARGPDGYHRLSRAISEANLASGRARVPDFSVDLLGAAAGGQWLVLTGGRKTALRRALRVAGTEGTRAELARLTALFGHENVAVELTATFTHRDAAVHDALAAAAREAGVPVVATGAVHCARPTDQALADVLAATRARRTVEELDGWRPALPAHLRSAAEMAQLHARHPQAVPTAARLAAECSFDLTLIAPGLPPFPVPAGHTEATWLRHLTEAGARERYGPRDAERTPGAWDTIDHELQVITELGFPGYFLIVHEIVEFCRSRGILVQGRGSAANSAVCFALGITAVDAVRHKMLFERFLSPGRSGPPDIDLDIESGRREEVIQFVYQRYSRHHAAQVANVISYRPRSAVRDTARALGHSAGQADAWAKGIERWREIPADAGIPPRVAHLAGRLLRLPRHLGIHPGGMVLCDRPVVEVCPVQWATKEGRTVLQWDKDDCADAGLVKFDLLGLGMLTALRLAFDELTFRGILHQGRPIGLHDLPQDDPRVYRLLTAADTVGVFQVESRAQMATLPRLRPRTFYDIVVEVALIRPGPIQGNSVNPYLKRRLGREPVTYLHPLLKPALERTLGVPLFQEQLMQIAIDAAAFTPAQADQLRKAMGSKRSPERMEALHASLLEGMHSRGIPPDVAEQIYDKLRAFADFGFPESHSFSFAYLVYVSAWLKVHHPEVFYAALLAAQPMGFYSPQTLIQDARRHGVRILPVDVTSSEVLARVEYGSFAALPAHPLVDAHADRAVRLGLAQVRGIGPEVAQRIVSSRAQRPFTSPADLAARVELTRGQLEALATAGALRAWGTRRAMTWAAGALAGEYGQRQGSWVQPPLPGTAFGTRAPQLPELTEVEVAVADMWATQVTPTSFPTQFVRRYVPDAVPLARVAAVEPGSRIRVAGVITHRQRPHTAAGITFLSVEDETGLLNVVCSPGLWRRYRTVARTSPAVVVRGLVERQDGVVNLVADRLDPLPLRVPSRSRDFR